jgi:Tfp pilus assembly protein PilF
MKKLFSFFLLAVAFAYNVTAQTIQDARKLTENEQYEAASALYRSLLEKNPSDVSLYYYYGDNLLKGDNPDSAKIIFEQGAKVDSKNPLLMIGNAKLLLDDINVREAKASSNNDGSNPELRIRYEEAVENVKRANELIDQAVLNTKDIQVMIEAAEALINYKNKDTDKAKSLLDKAAAIDQLNIDVLLLYGDLYTELNNGTLAADYYNRALDQKKTSARAIVSKGKLYKRSTNYESAAEEFRNAIKIEPGYAPAYRELGECYIKLGQLAKGKEEYRKYLELSKNNCGARIRYATILYSGKDYANALSELDQVKERCDSNNSTMLRVQSYCYYETKEYEKGLNTVNHLFRRVAPDKRTATDYEYSGKLLIKSNMDSAGIIQLQKAFALDPTRVDLLSDIADAWIDLKNYPNAIDVLNQKLALGRDVKIMDYYSLSRAFYFNENFIEADSIAKKANDLSPTWIGGWMLRAQVNAQRDSTSEEGLAKPFYEKIIELSLADSIKYQKYLIESYTYLAYYYVLKKDTVPAIMYLEKKLEMPLEAEDRKNVQDAIDRLKGRKANGNKTK